MGKNLKIKGDKKLKELTDALIQHCIEQKYNCVVSVDEDETDDSIIKTSGKVDSLVANIVATVMDMEATLGENFAMSVYFVLAKCLVDKAQKRKLH